jgi:hypothetical protein
MGRNRSLRRNRGSIARGGGGESAASAANALRSLSYKTVRLSGRRTRIARAIETPDKRVDDVLPWGFAAMLAQRLDDSGRAIER